MRFLLKLFSEESAFGRFLNRLYYLVTANLLFLLFSLPVVTIGAAWTALMYTMMKLQRGDKHFKVTTVFWKGFRENWKKATLAFGILAALVLLQMLEISWCRQFRDAVSLFRYVLFGLMVLEGIIALYLFPVIAAFHGGMRELLRDAMYFAFARPHWMLLNVALYALPVAGTYLYLTYLPLWAFLWGLIGFSLIAFLSSKMMLRIFAPFLPEVDICGDVIPPGMEDDPNILVADSKSEDLSEEEEKTLREMMKYGL